MEFFEKARERAVEHKTEKVEEEKAASDDGKGNDKIVLT